MQSTTLREEKERRCKNAAIAIFGIFGAINREFNRRFESFREGYRDLLAMCLRNTRWVVVIFIGFAALSMFLVPWLGQDFFPAVDAGQFTLHIRAKSGTRIEEVARQVDKIEGRASVKRSRKIS